ncbi:unnamed protein product [Cylindrotheca closterium]|uniref:Uncharacterized protein n=1 Tax=Cylindrotheca closterium TaxID=2856 RepID=A0AAD2GAM4_9STRA|nr:unnamed protein product [Cylindrotheca closterium]
MMKSILLLITATSAFAGNRIAGYDSHTLVIDQNKIDLDQRDMEQQLALGSNDGYDSAIKIYQKGSHCASYSLLKIQPLEAVLTAGDQVTGVAQDGSIVKATVAENYPKGTIEIEVVYNLDETSSSFCHVGGNPRPITDGCFADSGRLAVNSGDPGLKYSYNVFTDTLNGISIQKLSTEKRTETSYWCDSCKSDDFDVFYKLYGEHDYADKWFEAARLGTSTNFFFGDADFRSFGLDGKLEAMTTATLALHIWMHVVFLLEDSVGKCRSKYGDHGINSWDKAVAYYTGSMEGPESDVSQEGFLLKQLANKFCKAFKTCGPDGDAQSGEAYVNTEILRAFKNGLTALKDGRCSSVETNKVYIAEMMRVPLVQGLLVNSYAQQLAPQRSEKAEAAGATFLAAVVPFVYNCNPADAATLVELMGASSFRGNTDFPKVKAILEQNYKCMRINCADIGGIWNSNSNDYYPDSLACEGGFVRVDMFILGITLAAGGALMVCLILACTCCTSSKHSKVDNVPDEDEEGVVTEDLMPKVS